MGAIDSLRSDLHASFALGLKLPRPLQVDAMATAETDSARGSLAAEIDGAVTPLQLRGTLRGKEARRWSRLWICEGTCVPTARA